MLWSNGVQTLRRTKATPGYLDRAREAQAAYEDQRAEARRAARSAKAAHRLDAACKFVRLARPDPAQVGILCTLNWRPLVQ